MSDRSTQIKHVAIDVTGLRDTRKGQKIYNALSASGATQFVTKRGHEALLMDVQTFAKVQSQMKLKTEPTYDGLESVVVPADTHDTVVIH